MVMRVFLMAMLPALAGCQSYTWLVYGNPPLGGARQGQECRLALLGLGRDVDLTGNEAMRLGGITKVRGIEYQVNTFHGMGKECIIANGD